MISPTSWAKRLVTAGYSLKGPEDHLPFESAPLKEARAACLGLRLEMAASSQSFLPQVDSHLIQNMVELREGSFGCTRRMRLEASSVHIRRLAKPSANR